jgi:hypothetical protein
MQFSEARQIPYCNQYTEIIRLFKQHRMRPYFDWSFMAGTFGLVGPIAGLFVGGVPIALAVSTRTFFFWVAILLWGWFTDGAIALLWMLPSLFPVLLLPGALVAIYYFGGI